MRTSTLYVAVLLVAGCSGGTGPGPGPDDSVLGVFESLDADGHAIGWTLAPSFDAHPLEAAVFADGDGDTGTLIWTVRANQTRDDVAASTGVPGEHGMTFEVPDNLRDGATHELHVYGLGPDGMVELDGSPKSFAIAGTGTGNEPRAGGSDAVAGNVDVIDTDGVMTGWTLVPSFTSHPIQIAVFADGDRTTGTLLYTARANIDRPDLEDQFGTIHHGFDSLVPDELMDRQPHSLTIYGMGPHGMTLLVGSPYAFQLASATPIGVIDGIDTDGNATGWAVVPSRAPASIDVDIFVDDPAGAGTPIATVHADVPRPDVNTATGLDGDHGFSFRIPDPLRDQTDHELTAVVHGPRATVAIGTTPFNLEFVFPRRHGIVHADGRSWVDDDGAFYPLGGTLFWAMYGWKNDRDRLVQNLEYLANHHYDYVRILAEVDWPGESISPSWPDYAQVLGELIDYAYDHFGLRVEITMIGGGNGVDFMGLAQTIVGVVTANRQHKVLDVEVANESYQRPISLDQMRQVGTYFMQSLPGQMVALSSAEGLGAYAPGTTDWIGDTINTYLQPGTANLVTIHMDRGYGDDGWREVRQPWDWKDFPVPVSHNEPIGPRSSVAEEVDPIRLGMLRAVGIINGVEAFVLHNGSGVAGVVDPAHNRPANLWEVPNIDAIMDTVRAVDAILPARAGDGQHWNNAWAGNPWVADAFWSDGADHGVNRNYTVSTPDGWISTESGIKDHVVMTPRQHCRIQVFDLLAGMVEEVELGAGEAHTLTPVSRDSGNYGALIVIGHYL